MSEAKDKEEAIRVRRATIDDVPFIVDIVIAAERVRTTTISYQKVFELDMQELREMLTEILKTDIEHHELTYTSFYIAEVDGAIAGGMAGFVNGQEGIPSRIIKANLLAKYVGVEKWKLVKERLEKLATLNVERTMGAAQIEYAYVMRKYQRRKIPYLLGSTIRDDLKRRFPELRMIEVQTTKENIPIIKASEQVGFRVVEFVETDNEEILKYMPYNNRVIMRLFYNKEDEQPEIQIESKY